MNCSSCRVKNPNAGSASNKQVSYSFWKILSLLGEYLMSFVISQVVFCVLFINIDGFSVSAAAKLRAWP